MTGIGQGCAGRRPATGSTGNLYMGLLIRSDQLFAAEYWSEQLPPNQSPSQDRPHMYTILTLPVRVIQVSGFRPRAFMWINKTSRGCRAAEAEAGAATRFSCHSLPMGFMGPVMHGLALPCIGLSAHLVLEEVKSTNLVSATLLCSASG